MSIGVSIGNGIALLLIKSLYRHSGIETYRISPMTIMPIIKAIGSLGALDINAAVAVIILSVGWAGERILKGSAELVRARKGKK